MTCDGTLPIQQSDESETAQKYWVRQMPTSQVNSSMAAMRTSKAPDYAAPGLRLAAYLVPSGGTKVTLLRRRRAWFKSKSATLPRIRCCLKYLPITTAKITLQAAWRRTRSRVDMPDVHFHDLRHSAASEMVNAGIDLYTVGMVLGHRDPRSTQRYAHLTAGTLADAVGQIGRKSPHKPAKKAAAAKSK